MAQRLSVSWMFWKKQLEGHTPSTRFASRRWVFFHILFFGRELPFTSKGSSTSTGSLGWADKGMKKESLMILRSFGMWNWKSNTACWGRIPEDCTSHTLTKSTVSAKQEGLQSYWWTMVRLRSRLRRLGRWFVKANNSLRNWGSWTYNSGMFVVT